MNLGPHVLKNAIDKRSCVAGMAMDIPLND